MNKVLEIAHKVIELLDGEELSDNDKRRIITIVLNLLPYSQDGKNKSSTTSLKDC
jgi:hypothetical protein